MTPKPDQGGEKLAKVEEIKDLFSTSGKAYIVKVMDEYDDGKFYHQRATAEEVCNKINAFADTWKSRAVKEALERAKKDLIPKTWALEAVRGRHSLCADALFFGEVEKEIGKKIEVVQAEQKEKDAKIAEDHYWDSLGAVGEAHGKGIAAAIRRGQ